MANNRSISDIRPPKRRAAGSQPQKVTSVAQAPEQILEEAPVAVLPTQPVISPDELIPASKGKSRKVWIILGTILVLIVAAGAILLFWVNARG